MPTIEFANSSIRDSAMEALEDSFTHSNYHDGMIERDDAVYSDTDDDWYIDDTPGLCCCQYSRCGVYYHREMNDCCIHTEDEGHDYCSDECALNDDQYGHEDGCWYGYPESNGTLQEYHTGTRDIRRTTDDTPFLIGFEIEKCDSVGRESLEGEEYLVDGWIAEDDSSISGDGGFELISPAYNLADVDAIKHDINTLSYYVNADSDQSCGGHITISKRGVTGYQLADDNRGLFPLLMCLYPKRLRSSFVKSGKYDKIVDSDDKYRPFRIDDSKIELRIISRVINVDCLLWRLDLLRYMLESQLTLDDTRESLRTGWLYFHLRKVYSSDQLQAKLSLFDEFAAYFYDMVDTVSSHIAEYLTEQV